MVGIHGHADAARLAVLALHALQHRGQEGAGVATWDGAAMRCHRGQGLVGEVFGPIDLAPLAGSVAIGNVRRGTGGGDTLRKIQPLVVRSRAGQVAIAHDGNLVNAQRLRQELEARGSIFNSSADTEVLLHLLAASAQETFVNRLVEALYQVEGATSMVLLAEGRLVAVRDPWGFRPLVLGRLGEAWVVASESCALDLLGARLIREIEAGEMIIIDAQGLQSLQPLPRRPRRACVFEQITFARPDSVVFGRPVYGWRHELGRRLAEEHPVAADLVIPVPDTGLPGALGFADQSRLPFQLGLLRSPYVGRTFIEPCQPIRDLGVQLELSPVREVLAGRRVVVVDDSLVRGTTARRIVRMLRDQGAAEVHLRITAPPTTGGCFYGVDTPERNALLAARMSPAQIGAWLEADSLGYLSLEGLRAVQGEDRGRYCEACFSGDYPVSPGADGPAQQLPLFVPGA